MNARNVMLSVPTNKKMESSNARTAKYAAFIYLVGLKSVNKTLVPEDSLRRHLDKVLTFLKKKTERMGNTFKCGKDWFDGNDDETNLGRGIELPQLLQTYDLKYCRSYQDVSIYKINSSSKKLKLFTYIRKK